MPLGPPPGFEPIYESPDSDVKTEPEELIPPPNLPGSDPKSKKRAAAGDTASEAAAKRPKLFNRVFSQADEIALLKGMIEFAENYKSSPLDNFYGLLEFVRPSLECYISKRQLESKVSKFRWKFIRNLVKEQLGGEKARKLKIHEQRAFDLSKLVWDNQYIRNDDFEMRLNAALKRGIPKKKKKKNKKNVETRNKKKNDEAMEAAERKKIQDEKLEIAKLKIFYKKVCLIKTQTEIVLDALENK